MNHNNLLFLFYTFWGGKIDTFKMHVNTWWKQQCVFVFHLPFVTGSLELCTVSIVIVSTYIYSCWSLCCIGQIKYLVQKKKLYWCSIRNWGILLTLKTIIWMWKLSHMPCRMFMRGKYRQPYIMGTSLHVVATCFWKQTVPGDLMDCSS